MLFVYWWPATTRFAAERGLELVRIVASPGERSRGYTQRFVTLFGNTPACSSAALWRIPEFVLLGTDTHRTETCGMTGAQPASFIA